MQDNNVNRRKRQEDYDYMVKIWRDAMDHVGVEDDEFYLVEPAMEAQRKLSKAKAARASNNFGWNQFNSDAMYKGHEKRVKAAFQNAGKLTTVKLLLVLIEWQKKLRKEKPSGQSLAAGAKNMRRKM